MRVLWTLPLLLAGALAGCLEDAPAAEASGPEVLALDELWNATEAVGRWSDFVTTFIKRDAFLPNNVAAREHLATQLAAMGLEVQLHTYHFGAAANGAGPLSMTVVEGIKPGTDLAHRRIGLTSHYDTIASTVQGAYDDGTGVAADLEICSILSQLPLRRTLSCLFFDAEELGALSSSAYVRDNVRTGDVTYDLVLGYDMVGLNWPGHAWDLNLFVGENVADWLYPFVDKTVHKALGLPENVMVYDFNDRNSDEAMFKAADVPTVRFAGGRRAADYPEYHTPGDTVDFVYDYAGGRDKFEAGFSAVVTTSVHLALAFDATDADVLARG